ncbi:MAG: hypothetical protein FLDDKLPJ_02300 [Phycisphaerae bacterium]|nr:hypothetical protein [Phycisphaerae bacterium]
MSVGSHVDRFCLFCGYNLHGLPSDLCPECGRAFDPANPRTFDVRPGGRHRAIRRRATRAVLATLVLFIAWALFPRGTTRTFITFRCTQCGKSLTVTRREPVPAAWCPLRLPGWTSRSEASGVDAEGDLRPACAGDHPAKVHAFDLGAIKIGTDITPSDGPYIISINGLSMTPDNAPAILKAMSVPGGAAVSMSVGSANPSQRFTLP